MTDNTRVIQSVVHYDDKCFFVSTINRESSAIEASGMRYAETLVWEYDAFTGVRGHLIGQGEASENSIRVHQNICARLHEAGKFDMEEE